jgi:ATP-dependent Clp protease ATP-binding subunit ClpA
MFERFNREARAAVIAAQEVARSSASRTVDTRHVLVALAEGVGPAATALRGTGVDVDALATGLRSELTASGLDPEALASLGIDLAAIRERTDAVFGPGALDSAGHSPGHIPFTRDAKKALQLALRETIRLGHRAIDGRHLLLGMLRADCPARDALDRRGIDLDELRTRLEQVDEPGSRSA